MRTLRNVAAALALMIALSVPAALALADEGVVTANTLNLRTGPGTSYSISWKLPARPTDGTRLKSTKRAGT